MKDIQQTPVPDQQPKKKISDIALTFIGLAALIGILMLIKFILQQMNILG
ncbi:MAG: hypothetical protein AB7U05_12775 [Mangrovibacterium sp.]